MAKFLHYTDDDDNAKAMAIPRVFSKNSRAKSSFIHDRNTICTALLGNEYFYKVSLKLAN